MRSYCEKNEDLIALKHELAAAETTHKDTPEKNESNIDDEYENISNNIKAKELERDIGNIRTVLSTFAPKLALLQPEEVDFHFSEN